METKLLKISMNKNSKTDCLELIEYMKSNIEYPKNEMEQKGYFWDSVFYESDQNKEFMYIVIKSEDFTKIMNDEIGLIESPFREVYEKFRSKCWSKDHYKDIEPLFCFNHKLEFAIN